MFICVASWSLNYWRSLWNSNCSKSHVSQSPNQICKSYSKMYKKCTYLIRNKVSFYENCRNRNFVWIKAKNLNNWFSWQLFCLNVDRISLWSVKWKSVGEINAETHSFLVDLNDGNSFSHWAGDNQTELLELYDKIY